MQLRKLPITTHTFLGARRIGRMPTKSLISRCWGQKEATRRRQQRETVPVARAAAPPGAQEYQSRECINCNSTAFRGSKTCENCGRPLLEEVVDQELLASAIEYMDQPEASAADKKTVSKKGDNTAGVLLAYDDRCRRHRDERTLGPFLGRGHPERPERVAAIMARLKESGVLKRCKRYKGREAKREELLAVHDEALLAAVEQATKVAVLAAERDKTTWYGPLDAQLEAMEGKNSKHIQDVYFNPSTAFCARLAAGSAAEVARHVVSGSARHGAAIIRPPGHHAESSVAMGFCYYNNAAVAARAAQAAGAQRVLIMDWDVHHGNGTQRIFYDDATVMYMSTHRYDHSCFYPGTGDATETGSGPGVGFTVNVPWNSGGVRDADMLAAFRYVIRPLAAEFRPDIIIVSAGFDAAEGDPLGGCRISTAGFSHFAATLSALAPTVMLLEGGYNLIATAAATEACLRVLLGEPPLQLQDRLQARASATTPQPQPMDPASDPWIMSGLEGVSDSAVESVCLALRVQSEFWEAARNYKALVEAAIAVRCQRKEQFLRPIIEASKDMQSPLAPMPPKVPQPQPEQPSFTRPEPQAGP
ncbi:hypothetical protein Vretimale_4232 [Volvox reticuliferus]|uniref:Histone deacetylase domain-containing protein n=1 Tax=Volvox reticuliferus TaxID=1737510 RepID=A0A8J4FE29_9CHLO|nr:hypothetical protein Vretifemale_2791 [Volvox reticuliferus]GIL98909.1 hypothetical protein Vretimale_4232 [Volvox reticuliferus]